MIKIQYPDWFEKTELSKHFETIINEPFAIILTGVPGCGKTAIADIVVNSIYEKHKNDGKLTVWCNTADGTYQNYLNIVSRPYFDGKNEQLEASQNVLCRKLVLLDDLGCEKDTAAASSFFQLAFSNHYKHVKSKGLNNIIITTNASFEQLGKIYGARVLDRMYEIFVLIEMTNSSYRARNKKVMRF